ncbi:MAG: hypothetical protein BWK79_16930 [Beggiatoa sp. IS2]|nr:MAG: hypothetical protein BWK79_16930 [Beggiatoa sp. IS2]
MTFALIIIAFSISVILTDLLSRPQSILYLIDQPNARSLHTRPIPVSGGVAFLTGLLIVTMIAHHFYPFPPPLIWIGYSSLMIAIISFIDDYRTLSPGNRLIVHFLAAILLLWQENLWINQLILAEQIWEIPLLLQPVISLLFIVWMTNLYNFMDGMDGFAGGMALFGFGTLAALGMLADHFLFMLSNLLIASAVAGFLIFNFPPARIFMGDTGASTLGFLAAAMSLWGQQEGIFALWIALLIFSPFIVDATITLLRRLWQGEKIWLAHKHHYYQRLVQLGWGHRRTVLWEYGLMASCSGSALLAPSGAGQWGLLGGWVLIYSGLIYLVGRLEQKAMSHLQ